LKPPYDFDREKSKREDNKKRDDNNFSIDFLKNKIIEKSE